MEFDVKCPACNSATYKLNDGGYSCPLCFITWPKNFMNDIEKDKDEFYVTHDMGGPIYHKKEKPKPKDDFKFWLNDDDDEKDRSE